MKKSTLLIITLLITNIAISQVGINTTTPESSLDVRAINHLGTVSATDGVLVPRVNNLSISGTIDGQLVYLIADNGGFTKGFHNWDGTQWVNIQGSCAPVTHWTISGNSGTTSGTNFIGTTDAQDLDLRTNNIISHRFTQAGQLEFLSTQGSVLIGENAGGSEVVAGPPFPFRRNVFIGYESGQSTTTGKANVFIGERAGNSNTTGFNNTFTGGLSGQNNTTGSANTFYGYESGLLNTTGLQNSFLGVGSGRSNLTGQWNTFMGYNSGRLSTGNNNTFIGAFSGDAVTSGNGNVLIGYNAGSFSTGSDYLYIETSDSNTPLIGGNFSTNRVGINRNVVAGLTNTFEVGGTASKATAGAWIANSDRRLKKNIQTISGKTALEKLLKLRGVSYEWDDTKTGNIRPEGIQYGFVAQELMEVFPEKVSKDVQGYYQTAYGDYDAFFVQAIKELHNQVTVRNTKIDALKEQSKSIDATSLLLKNELGELKADLEKIKKLIQNKKG